MRTFTAKVKTLNIGAMMDITEIRHRNLRLLVAQLEDSSGKSGDRSGGLVMLAEKLKKSAPQVSHFAGKKPTKAIGDKVAREIEEAFCLERGWLDWAQWDLTGQDIPWKVAPLSASQVLRQQISMIAETVKAMRVHAERHYRPFTLETEESAASFVHWLEVRENLPDAKPLDNLIEIDDRRDKAQANEASGNGRSEGVSATGTNGRNRTKESTRIKP